MKSVSAHRKAVSSCELARVHEIFHLFIHGLLPIQASNWKTDPIFVILRSKNPCAPNFITEFGWMTGFLSTRIFFWWRRKNFRKKLKNDFTGDREQLHGWNSHTRCICRRWLRIWSPFRNCSNEWAVMSMLSFKKSSIYPWITPDRKLQWKNKPDFRDPWVPIPPPTRFDLLIRLIEKSDLIPDPVRTGSGSRIRSGPPQTQHDIPGRRLWFLNF